MGPEILHVQNFKTYVLGHSYDIGEVREFTARKDIIPQKARLWPVADGLRPDDSVIQK
jgi:hypothetical protein